MIVTTALKANCVNSLHDYMEIKGMYMKYRLNPTHADSTPGYYTKIVKFIERHTDIPKSRYWYEMDDEQKERFTRFLHFSDDVPNQFNIRSDMQQAQICIVLNGNADVLTRKSSGKAGENTETKETFQQGKSFGSFDTFDESYDQLVDQEIMNTYPPDKKYRIKQKEKKLKQDIIDANGGKEPDELIPTMMTVLMEKGTWLHIGIRDYRDYVLKILPDIEEVEEETDEQISGIPLEKMTEKDFSCVAIKRQAKRKLAESMFNFMAKHELIPHNAAVLSSDFVIKCNHGRSIEVSKDYVYVIVDGRLCLEMVLNQTHDPPTIKEKKGTGTGTVTKIGTNRSDGTSETKDSSSSTNENMKKLMGTITIGMDQGPNTISDPFNSYKDPKVVLHKRRNMPVLRMEAGTLMALNDKHYRIGEPSNKKEANLNDMFDSNSHNHNHGSSFLPNISSSVAVAHDESSVLFGNHNNNKKDKEIQIPYIAPYTLRFVPETHVTLLAIPMKQYIQALKDLDSDSADDITSQLNASTDLTLYRMQPLNKWIQGSMRVIAHNPMNPIVKPKKTALELEEEKKKAIEKSKKSGRGILGGANTYYKTPKCKTHIRDIQTVDVLNDDKMIVKEKLEGTFLTTESLKDLNLTRKKEMEATLKQNTQSKVDKERLASSRNNSPDVSRTQSPVQKQIT
jgi:hypothetical protein